MAKTDPTTRRKIWIQRLRRLYLGLGLMVILLYVIRDILVFPLLRQAIIDQVQQHLGMKIEIDRLGGSVLGSFEIHGLKLLERPAHGLVERLEVKRIRIEYSPWRIQHIEIVSPKVTATVLPQRLWKPGQPGVFFPGAPFPRHLPTVDVSDADVTVHVTWDYGTYMVPDSVVVKSARIVCDETAVYAHSPFVHAAIVPDGPAEVYAKHLNWGFSDVVVRHNGRALARGSCDLSGVPDGRFNFSVEPAWPGTTPLRAFATVDAEGVKGYIAAQKLDLAALPEWFPLPARPMDGVFSGILTHHLNGDSIAVAVSGQWSRPQLGSVRADSAALQFRFCDGDFRFAFLDVFAKGAVLRSQNLSFGIDDGTHSRAKDGWPRIYETAAAAAFDIEIPELFAFLPDTLAVAMLGRDSGQPLKAWAKGRIDDTVLIFKDMGFDWGGRRAVAEGAYILMNPGDIWRSEVDGSFEIDGGDVSTLLAFLVGQSLASGALSGEAELRGSLGSPKIDASLESQLLVADRFPAFGHLRAIISEHGVRLFEIGLIDEGGAFRVGGSGLYRADSLQISLEGLAQLGPLSQGKVEGAALGQAFIRGPLTAPRGTFVAKAKQVSIAGIPLDSAAVSIETSRELRLDYRPGMEDPERGVISSSGLRAQIALAGQNLAFRSQVQGHASPRGFDGLILESMLRLGAESFFQTEPALLMAIGETVNCQSLRLQRGGEFVDVSLQADTRPNLRLDVAGESLDVARILRPWVDFPVATLPLESLRIVVRYSDGWLAVDRAFASAGGGQIAGQAEWPKGDSLRATIQAREINLGQWLPELPPGLALESLEARISGRSLEGLGVSAQSRLGYQVGDSLSLSAEGRVSLTPERILVAENQVFLRELGEEPRPIGRFSGGLRRGMPLDSESTQLVLEIDSDASTLDRWLGGGGIAQSGSLKGRLEWKHTRRGLGYQGSVSGRNVSLGRGRWQKSWDFDLGLSPDFGGHFAEITWRSPEAETLFVAEGRVPILRQVPPALRPGGEFDIRFRADRCHPGLLPKAIAESLWVGGRAQVRGRIHGQPGALFADAEIRLERAQFWGGLISNLTGTLEVDSALPGEISLEGHGRLGLAEAGFAVSLKPGSLEWSRLADPAQWTLGGEVQAQIPDLRTLPKYWPQIRYAEGDARLSAQLTGSLADPHWNGRAWLRQATFKSHRMLPPVDGVHLSVKIEDSLLTLEDGWGELGGAPFAVGGCVQLGRDPDLDFWLAGDNLLLFRNEKARVRGDVRLRITGPLSALEIGDSITIRSAKVETDLIPNPLQAVMQAGLTREGADAYTFRTGPLAQAHYNLLFKTDDYPIEVATSFARGRFGMTALWLRGQGSAPYLDGEIFLDQGDFFLPTTAIRGDQGLLAFAPGRPFDPDLNLRGRAQILNYQVHILVGGAVSAPEVELSTVPPMSHNDAVALVLTGRPPEDAYAARSGDDRRATALGNVAVFVARDFFVKSLSGSDDWERFWRQLLEEIEVEVGGGAIDETYAEIRLPIAENLLSDDDRLYLFGERSSLGSFNGGLKLVFRLP